MGWHSSLSSSYSFLPNFLFLNNWYSFLCVYHLFGVVCVEERDPGCVLCMHIQTHTYPDLNYASGRICDPVSPVYLLLPWMWIQSSSTHILWLQISCRTLNWAKPDQLGVYFLKIEMEEVFNLLTTQLLAFERCRLCKCATSFGKCNNFAPFHNIICSGIEWYRLKEWKK